MANREHFQDEDDFFRACADGNFEMVRERLEACTNEELKKTLMNHKNGFIIEYEYNGNKNVEGTPLLVASYNGHEAVVSQLLQNGAELNAVISSKEVWLDKATALHLAAFHGKEGCVRLLLAQAGSNPNSQTSYKITPLIFAVMRRNAEICRILLDHEADVDIQDTRGRTALHMAVAVILYNEKICRILLDHKADVNIRDNEGETALQKAIENRREDIVLVLLQYKHLSASRELALAKDQREWMISALIIENSCSDLMDDDIYLSTLQERFAEHKDLTDHFGSVFNMPIYAALSKADPKDDSLSSATTRRLVHVIDKMIKQKWDIQGSSVLDMDPMAADMIEVWTGTAMRDEMGANAIELYCRAIAFHSFEAHDLVMEKTWKVMGEKVEEIKVFTVHCLLLWACKHLDVVSDMHLSKLLKQYGSVAKEIFGNVKFPLKLIIAVCCALEDAASKRFLLSSDLHTLQDTLRSIGCMIVDNSNMDSIPNTLEAFGVSCTQDMFLSKSAISVALENNFSDLLSLPQIQHAVDEFSKGPRHWSEFKVQDLRYIPICFALCNFWFYLVYLYMTYQVVHDGEGFDFQSFQNLIFFLMSCGYLWAELDQLKKFGFAPYKDNPWNIWDITFLTIFFGWAVFVLSFSNKDSDNIILANRWLSLNLFILPFRCLEILSLSTVTGIFVVIIHQMFVDIFNFLVIIGVVIVGFSGVFSFAVSDVDEFSSLGTSIQSLFGASLGDFDFGWFDESDCPVFARFLLFGYLLLSMIMMMNLLIAVLSDSYSTLMAKKYEMWCLIFSNIVKDSSVPHAFPANFVFPPATYMLNACIRPLMNLHYLFCKKTWIFAQVACGLMLLYDTLIFLLCGIPASFFILIPTSMMQFKQKYTDKGQFNYFLYVTYPLYHVYFVLIRWIFFSGEGEHQTVSDLKKAGKYFSTTSITLGAPDKKFFSIDGVVNHSKMSLEESLAAIKGKRVVRHPSVLMLQCCKQMKKGWPSYSENIKVEGAKEVIITVTENSVDGDAYLEVRFMDKEGKAVLAYFYGHCDEPFKFFLDEFKIELYIYSRDLRPDERLSFEIRPIFDSHFYEHKPLGGGPNNGIYDHQPLGGEADNVPAETEKEADEGIAEAKTSGEDSSNKPSTLGVPAEKEKESDEGIAPSGKVLDSAVLADKPSTLGAESKEETNLPVEGSTDNSSNLGAEGSDETNLSVEGSTGKPSTLEGPVDECEAKKDANSTSEQKKPMSSKGCWSICSLFNRMKGYEVISGSDEKKEDRKVSEVSDDNPSTCRGWNIFSKPKEFDECIVFDEAKKLQPRLLQKPEIKDDERFNVTKIPFERFYETPHWLPSVWEDVQEYVIMDQGNELQQIMTGVTSMDNKLDKTVENTEVMADKTTKIEAQIMANTENTEVMADKTAKIEAQIMANTAKIEAQIMANTAKIEAQTAKIEAQTAKIEAQLMEIMEDKFESLNAAIKHLTELNQQSNSP